MLRKRHCINGFIKVFGDFVLFLYMVRLDVVAERNTRGLGLVLLGPGWFGLVPQLD